MDPVRFVKKHGVVLEGGTGPRPSLAEEISGEPIRGNWWGHAKGREIFRATRAVRDSDDVLVCRLVGGKITYVHRQLWPALVRLADSLDKKTLAALREEHTKAGAHKVRTLAFSRWVTPEIRRAADRLSEAQALKMMGDWVAAYLRAPRKPAR